MDRSPFVSSTTVPSDHPKSHSSSTGAKKSPPTTTKDGVNGSAKSSVSEGDALPPSVETRRLLNQIPIRASNDASKKEDIAPTPTSTSTANDVNDLTTLFSHMRVSATKAYSEESSTSPANVSGTMDPALCLDDGCFFLVLSFVGPTKVTQQEEKDATDDEAAASVKELYDTEGNDDSPKDATEASDILGAPQTPLLELVKFYFTFASVSRNWKRLVEKLIVSLGGLVRVDFDALSTQNSQRAVAWLCHHKPKLAGVTGLFPAGQKVAFVDVMRKCNTEDLVDIGFLLVVRAPGEHTAESEAQKDLQDVVAEECPKLTAIKLEFAFEIGAEVRSEYPEVLSPRFLSLGTVQATFISFFIAASVSPGFISNLVGNFPSLKMVALRSSGGVLDNRDTVVKIASQSLKSLIVASINGSQGALLSLDCPSLQHFVCSGEKRITWNDNGPNIYVKEKVVAEGTNVPEECGATVEFDEPGKHGLYVPFHFLLEPNVHRSLEGAKDWYDDESESDNESEDGSIYESGSDYDT